MKLRFYQLIDWSKSLVARGQTWQGHASCLKQIQLAGSLEVPTVEVSSNYYLKFRVRIQLYKKI